MKKRKSTVSSFSADDKEKSYIEPDKLQTVAKEKTDATTPLQKNKTVPENTAALYTLWFGLDYGSILTAYALYKTLEQLGFKSCLIQKDPALWSEHYADKDNIAGKFIYENCDVLEVFSDEKDKELLDGICTRIVGSDVMWDCGIINNYEDMYFCLKGVNKENVKKIAYGTSFGGNCDIPVMKRSEYMQLLCKFNGISVKCFREAVAMSDMFGIDPEIVLDPVFLCDKQKYIQCAESSAANTAEEQKSFVFSYIKNGDERKRDLLTRGYVILLEKYASPLRNFVDINRYPESTAALGLEPAYHILVNDWLHYIINSDFVITDDYYGMCFAILFRKNFVVVYGRDMKDLSRYTTLLDQLGLTERLVYLDDDFKTKEYLFRKPIKYDKCSTLLEQLKDASLKWLTNVLNGSDK